MASLTIGLLGGFEVRLGAGTPLNLPTKKSRALLAFLALRPGKSHARDELADLLWANSGEQARGSLRRALSDLRKAMGDRALAIAGDAVALAPDGLEVDVVTFERLAASDKAADWEAAAALYRGEFLAGFGLREESFETWLRIERDRLRALVLQTLGKLVDRYSATHAPELGISTAKRILMIDPTNEPAYRVLMTLYVRQGQRGEALKQYLACGEALMRELGVKPDAQTEQLHRTLQKPDGVVAASRVSEDSLADAWPLSDKPSIAVLPFANMSGLPDQDFFADGLTEDIIAALSRISALWVIAPTSTFSYRGNATNIKQVANDLGVRYVMAGSVRRSESRLRVAAQLADATTGREVWAERYDRPLADLFDIQDEITRSVAATTETQILLADAQSIETSPHSPRERRARDLVARALSRRYDQTPEAEAEAFGLAEEALRLDPAYPVAHRVRAGVVLGRLWSGELPSTPENRSEAMELARTALRLAPRDELAHLAMAWAWAYAETGHLEDAMAECDRGLEINPNCSLIMANKGAFLAALGRSEEAIDISQLALRLNPRDPSNFWRHYAISIAHFAAARYEPSLEFSRRVARSRAHVPSGIIWTAAAAALDDDAETRTAVAYCLSRRPDLRVSRIVPDFMLRYARTADHERLLANLRKAGLPE